MEKQHIGYKSRVKIISGFYKGFTGTVMNELRDGKYVVHLHDGSSVACERYEMELVSNTKYGN